MKIPFLVSVSILLITNINAQTFHFGFDLNSSGINHKLESYDYQRGLKWGAYLSYKRPLSKKLDTYTGIGYYTHRYSNRSNNGTMSGSVFQYNTDYVYIPFGLKYPIYNKKTQINIDVAFNIDFLVNHNLNAYIKNEVGGEILDYYEMDLYDYATETNYSYNVGLSYQFSELFNLNFKYWRSIRSLDKFNLYDSKLNFITIGMDMKIFDRKNKK